MLQSHFRAHTSRFSTQQQIAAGRKTAAASGALTAAGPLILLFGPGESLLWKQRLFGAGIETSIETLCAAALLTAGGLLLAARPSWGRGLATAGLAAGFTAHLNSLLSSPGMLLTAVLVCGLALMGIWRGGQLRHYSLLALHPASLMSRARAACLTALGGWLFAVLTRRGTDPWMVAAGAASLGLATLFAVFWLRRMHRMRALRWKGALHGQGAVRWKWIVGVSVAVLAAVALAWPHRELTLTLAAILPAAALVLTLLMGPADPALRLKSEAWTVESEGWNDTLFHQPARLLVTTFGALCVLGTLLLSLPISTTRPEGISVIDAAFTAVSAVCVTGLIVLDTPRDFSGFGQAAILLLIQLGALGIMTFSTAALGLLGRRLSLRHEAAVAGTLSAEGRHDLFRALRRLLTITVSAELIGTAVLGSLFVREGDAPLYAFWRGLFTAVSAFCNAGFALQSDSLISYQGNAWILHTVALLIMLGGLSPAAIAALPALLGRRRVAVQVKLAFCASLALWVGGALAITAIEWNNSLGGLSFFGRLHNGWLQSVTLRTAGFNSIDIAAAHPPVLTLMMLWMFIGGSPGGTAGGIKTTTAAVLALAVAAAVRGRSEVVAFQRRISTETVYKAAAVATLGLATAMAALVAVQLTQDLPGVMAPFEVVSALGTVGLSIGGTARLDAVGKIIILLTMFMGRVGPLTLFLFLSDRFSKSVWEFPEERIDVG